MDELERKYRALAARISRHPMTATARVRILAEIEAAYRRERAHLLRRSPRRENRH